MPPKPLDSEATAWLSLLRASGRRPATLLQYEWALRLLEETMLGHGLASVTRTEAVAFVESLRFRMKPGSVSAALRVLKTFYRHLVVEEVITKSPFERINVKVPEKIRPAMTATDIESMAAKAHDARDRAVLFLLADTGARKGEVANVDLSDVDLTSGVITFRVSKTKPRSVPLSDRAVLHLQRYLRKRGTKSGNLWGGDPYDYVRRAIRQMSGGTWTPHDLRRYFAIGWLTKGGSESGLMRICGWTTTEMLRLYTRASADVLAADEFRRLLA